MVTSRRRLGLFALPLLGGLAACATVHAPSGTVPTAEGAQQDAFGGWAIVTQVVDGTTTLDEGELLAVSPDSLWLLDAEGARAIAAGTIRRAEVTGYDSRPGRVVGRAFLGVLSTIGNGAFLVFTAPAWIITGAAASSSQARGSRLETVGRDLTPLATYARFPRGIPTDLDPATLRPRPAGHVP